MVEVGAGWQLALGFAGSPHGLLIFLAHAGSCPIPSGVTRGGTLSSMWSQGDHEGRSRAGCVLQVVLLWGWYPSVTPGFEAVLCLAAQKH